MNFISKKLTTFFIAPKIRLFWLALTFFFLGAAVCPFNPPVDDEVQYKIQGEIMNIPSKDPRNIVESNSNPPALHTGQMETAMFALG